MAKYVYRVLAACDVAQFLCINICSKTCNITNACLLRLRYRTYTVKNVLYITMLVLPFIGTRIGTVRNAVCREAKE